MSGPAGFILAAGLASCSAGSSDVNVQSSYMSAAGQAAEAAYIDSGMKKQTDAIFQSIERKYIPKELEKYGSITAIVLKTVYEQKLVLTFQF